MKINKGPAWPAAHVEMRAVARLLPYAKNARKHSQKQVNEIAASIKEFGWTIPVLVDEDDEIIAGHGRVLAAKSMGIEEVPTMVAVGWTDAQKRAYRLADNQLTINSEWDEDLLKSELDQLSDDGFNVGLLGFGDDLKDFMAGLPSGGAGDSKASGVLAERFGVPPFTVLNAREGSWQDRKRAWIALGIKSEIGRGNRADAASE